MADDCKRCDGDGLVISDGPHPMIHVGVLSVIDCPDCIGQINQDEDLLKDEEYISPDAITDYYETETLWNLLHKSGM